LWDMNTKISPDYVHYLHKAVEDATGAVSIFMNGALGGMITSVLDDDTGYSDRRRFYRNMGRAFGEIAAATWEQIRPTTIKEIVHRHQRRWFPVDNKQFTFMANLGVFQREFRRNEIETRIDFWQIGSAQFVTLPGEPLPSVGFAAKDLLTGDPAFLFGLGNDELGYLVSDREADDPRYAYERSMSVGPDATNLFLETIDSLVRAK